MTDLPPGQWSPVLVGHQWPGSDSLWTLKSASISRESIRSAFDQYADLLHSARTGPLGDQEGLTADDGRDSFERGESLARETAEKNLQKHAAYESSGEAVRGLKDALSLIASEGNTRIDKIRSSDAPAAIKLEQIVEAVIKGQTDANAAAASSGGQILGEIQTVLDTSTNAELSSRQFARLNGVDTARMFSSGDQVTVRSRVKELLEEGSPAADNSELQGRAATNGAPSGLEPSVLSTSDIRDSHRPCGIASPVSKPATGTPYAAPSTADGLSAPGTAAGLRSEGAATFNPPAGRGASASADVVRLAQLEGAANAPRVLDALQTDASLTQQPPLIAAPSISAASQLAASPAPPPNGDLTVSAAHAFTPESLAQNFNAGIQAGAPVSTGTEALSNNAIHAIQPQSTIHTEPVAPLPMANTGSGMPILEAVHAAHVPVEAAATPLVPAAEGTHTVLAAPVAPAAPAMAPGAAMPPAQAGQLPAYGSDLRPTSATIPAAPASSPGALPASAPVGTASSGSANQPAVVRQQPTASAPTSAGIGLTEKAAAATTIGAVTGAAVERTAARQRLQRLVEAVASQEPKLRWAIGDREDGTTLLVTDLASGWIPPHIRIPAGVTLLEPGRRSPALETLLGNATLTATYRPGQFLPAADKQEPVATSIRSRRTADVAELGWELVQATKWRDGLPRLAHTLAKAICARTGCLDSETDLLRDHLNACAAHVLGAYPEADHTALGNWQLLATIDALTVHERTCANYHFAWFQARSQPHPEGAHR